MSEVLHEINGNLYVYEHHRVHGEKNVKTEYMHPFYGSNGHYTVHGLRDGGFRDRPGYQEAHDYANQREKEKYGEKRFNELNNIIKEKLDKGELAGKYDNKNTYVNSKIPEEYHKQVRYHEEQERDFQRKHQHTIDGAHRHDKGDPDGLHDHPQYDVIKGAKIREEKVKAALQHADKLGAGAERRRSLGLTKQEHREAVMREYERGTLHTSSGKLVTERRQALAIAYSETGETRKNE